MLGGFSMGTVMSYALGLGPDRPAPAGILAFSGFIPTVEGWKPDLTPGRDQPHLHRPRARTIPSSASSFARRAREQLEPAGFELDYRESDAAHNIEPAGVRRATQWLAEVLAQ